MRRVAGVGVSHAPSEASERSHSSQRHAALLVGGTVGGAVLGLLASLVGHVLNLTGELWVAVVVLGAAAVAANVRWVPLPQFDNETPRAWLQLSVPLPQLLNGLLIGFGIATRIGFWIFFAFLAVLTIAPRPFEAMVSGALYGLLRIGLSLSLPEPESGPLPAIIRLKPAAVLVDRGIVVILSLASVGMAYG